MRIVFMGTSEFAVPALKMLYENHEVLLVVTQPDKAVGRKKEVIFSPVKVFANYVGINLLQPYDLKTIEDEIIALEPDYIVTAAYGQMLSKNLLDKVKSINIHGSLLPKYRGAAPIQYALFDGLKETGVTIMFMDYKMDTGPIIKQRKVDILDDDNYKKLMLRMSFIGTDLLKEVLENKITSTPQNDSDATYANMLTRADEFVDFNLSTKEIINKIKGLTPNIGGYNIVNNIQMKFYEVAESDIINNKAVPGTILSLDKHFIVKTKDSSLEILELQVPGKKKMSAKDFLNGQNVVKENDIFKNEV